MKEKWLTCKAGAGQMSSEFMVEGFTADGMKFSLFAPADFVQVTQSPHGWELVDARLLVKLIGEENGLSWIRLPRESYEMGHVVRVNPSQIESAKQLQGT